MMIIRFKSATHVLLATTSVWRRADKERNSDCTLSALCSGQVAFLKRQHVTCRSRINGARRESRVEELCRALARNIQRLGAFGAHQS